MVASAIEAMGMSLPYSSSTPATDPMKAVECTRAGQYAFFPCDAKILLNKLSINLNYNTCYNDIFRVYIFPLMSSDWLKPGRLVNGATWMLGIQLLQPHTLSETSEVLETCISAPFWFELHSSKQGT